MSKSRNVDVSSSALLAIWMIFFGLQGIAHSSDVVQLKLADGRKVSGRIEGSDGQVLRLQSSSRATTLIQSVDWSEIRAATLGGRAVSLTRLRELVNSSEAAADETSSPSTENASPAEFPPVGESIAERARRALGFAPQVASVRFEARLVNWSGGPDAEGLEIRVVPLTKSGAAFPCKGRLTVAVGEAAKSEGNTDECALEGAPLHSWNVDITPERFDKEGIVIRLPYTASTSEKPSSKVVREVVSVRLVIPGQGTFVAAEQAPRTASHPSSDSRTGRRRTAPLPVNVTRETR